jgi:NodT family efflux transporter outer membrane factor (OMF) lipoprotein
LNRTKPRGLPASPARTAGVALAAALALAGCAVGPDFRSPGAPPANGGNYTPEPLPGRTAAAPGAAGAAQDFSIGQDISAQWWQVFQSDALDRLIRAGLTRSPSLAAARAALRQAQEALSAQTGALLYPNLNGQLGVTREMPQAGTTALPPGSIFTLYNAAANVSYTLDVFGAARRELESLRAAVDYQRFQVEATYLALTANLVTSAIAVSSLRAQLAATREVLAAQEQQLGIIEKQFAAGAIARPTVLVQRTQVAQTRATLPPLEKALALTRHQLSVYAGKLPGEAGMPEFDLAALRLPTDLPVSLPSALVRQRPDVQASEALLHEASAQIGVATANLYPQITLSGSIGSAALQSSGLFGAGSGFWSIGAGLLQPIFNGGALSARRRAAIAAYDQAAAQYRGTVLTAFQNVADSLRALDLDAATLAAQADVEALARESLALATRQYQLGALSYLVLLDAQRTYQQARVSLVQARGARFADTAALFQALGGGWWNRPPLADISTAPHD